MIDGYVYKQTAIDAMECISDSLCEGQAIDALCELPSADVISVSWIEEQIKRLKEMDNEFASLAAVNISSLLRKWRDEVNDG